MPDTEAEEVKSISGNS